MADESSIWKKELRLRRRKTPAGSLKPRAVAVTANSGDGKPSIWKRELRLGRPSNSLPSPVPANPESSSVPPNEPVSEPGAAQGAFAEAEHPASEGRPTLLEPVPQWEGSPPLMPYENGHAAAMALAARLSGSRDADTPGWDQAEAQPEKVGGWGLDRSSENEFKPERWPAPSGPVEPAFDDAAPGVQGGEHVEPPAGEMRPQGEALLQLREAQRVGEVGAPEGAASLSTHTEASAEGRLGVEADTVDESLWHPTTESDASSSYNSQGWPAAGGSAEPPFDDAAPGVHGGEELEPIPGEGRHESEVPPQPREAQRVGASAAPEDSVPWWMQTEARPEGRLGGEADTVGQSLRNPTTESDVSSSYDRPNAFETQWPAPAAETDGPDLEQSSEPAPAEAVDDSASSVVPPAEVPAAAAAPWVPRPVEFDVAPVPVPHSESASSEAGPSEAPVVPKSKQSLLKRELHFSRPGGRKATVSSASLPTSSVAKNLVGLRIGSSQLAAAYVHNNGSAELVQVARSPLGPGIVSGGEVRDPDALTRALKAFFSEHKLPRRGVRIGIASNRIGVRILDVPAADDPRLFENSVRFHAQETLPIAVTDAILQHVVLGEGAGVGLEPTVRVLLVFAHRELVERHVDACRRAGLKLAGIDFEAFALLRALAEPRPADVEPERAVVAVAVGNERTIFAVSDGRICDFTRVLEWGGGSLDVAIARALDLTPSQAEPVKLALALDADVAPSQLSAEQADAARAAIRTELQSLARELVSSLQFYQARSGSLDIGEILLSGGGSQLAGFPDELERLVGVPVRVGDPLSRVSMGKKVGRPAESGSLAVAIGLGIED